MTVTTVRTGTTTTDRIVTALREEYGDTEERIAARRAEILAETDRALAASRARGSAAIRAAAARRRLAAFVAGAFPPPTHPLPGPVRLREIAPVRTDAPVLVWAPAPCPWAAYTPPAVEEDLEPFEVEDDVTPWRPPKRGAEAQAVIAEDLEWLVNSGERCRDNLVIRLGAHSLESLERQVYRYGLHDLWARTYSIESALSGFAGIERPVV